MTSSTIIEVVEKLVGSIKPVGETYEDSMYTHTDKNVKDEKINK